MRVQPPPRDRAPSQESVAVSDPAMTLWSAIEEFDVETVTACLAIPGAAELANNPDDQGWTALMMACSKPTLGEFSNTFAWPG